MKEKIVFLFLLLCFKSFSQGGFRTRFYPQNAITSITRDVFETSPGSYIAGGVIIDTINGYQVSRLILLGLNSNGNVLWQKKYGRKNFEYYNNPFTSRFFYKQGSNIYTACSALDSNNKVIGVLIKFDLNGDTLWQKIYHDSMDVIPQMVTGSIDGGFLITGFFQDWNGSGSPCMLIKTDSYGNELWRKKINKAGHNVSDGKAIIQDTATGKIVIAGYQYVGSLSSSQLRDHILITDSVGNKLIQRSYYGANSGHYKDLIQTKDKNVIAVGIAYKNQYIGTDQLNCSFIIKIDINGTQTTPPIWSNTNFDPPKVGNIFTCIKEMPNGNLLVGGVIDTLSIVQNWSLIRISRLNPNGTLISQRYYDYKINSPTSDNNHDLKSLNFTSDGGWVAGIGQVNFPSPNPLFYVKYDSTGCDSTVDYCLNPVGVEELQGSTFGSIQGNLLKVWPNPVENTLHLYYAGQKDFSEIQITDVLGNCVLTEGIVAKQRSSVSIDVQTLNPGIYLVQLLSKDGTIVTAKFIKQ